MSVNPHHYDKQEARRRREQTGQPYASALAATRRERQDPSALADAETNWPNHHDVAAPTELTNLLRAYTRKITKFLHDALDESRYHTNDFAEWQRLVLYKLTDALSYHRLVIGAIAGFLREEGVSAYALRRYLQLEGGETIESFLTPQVVELLAGLRGRPNPGHSASGLWHAAGTRIAAPDPWDTRLEDEVETFLSALFTNHSDDNQALDHLPEQMKNRVLTLLPQRTPPPDPTT